MGRAGYRKCLDAPATRFEEKQYYQINENEISVKLCNYIDVYKNEFFNSSIDFMQANADESEIKRFTIEKSDVLIIKDSEMFDDIAIPALATETLEGVLCGYHLAQFKTKEKTI